ncbi:hypothetical protein SKAU_G00092750 [Synaphobranchus kaupii]|uniref:Uncharacterized protein n=1 Tax=Synaphobranchus kaupii TaxID=118154 RepID=A0A9Q1FXI3_SYNKA|nr:hypothetical protein SKAU_G00092750 [Synaphobranchus kaupii]
MSKHPASAPSSSRRPHREVRHPAHLEGYDSDNATRKKSPTSSTNHQPSRYAGANYTSMAPATATVSPVTTTSRCSSAISLALYHVPPREDSLSPNQMSVALLSTSLPQPPPPILQHSWPSKLEPTAVFQSVQQPGQLSQFPYSLQQHQLLAAAHLPHLTYVSPGLQMNMPSYLMPYPQLGTTYPNPYLPTQHPGIAMTAPPQAAAPPAVRRRSYKKVEGLTFPNFTKKDETEYNMLRMALDNLLDPEETEQYKYHVLLDHLKVDQARCLALAFSKAPDPFSRAPRPWMGVMTLEGQGEAELACGSHVEWLLEKLPTDQSCRFKKHISRIRPEMIYTLMDFSTWLQLETSCQPRKERPPAPGCKEKSPSKATSRPATILHGADQISSAADQKLTREQKVSWINERCWRCARTHLAAQCTIKKPCQTCNRKHLQILHKVNQKPTENTCLVNSAVKTLYLDQPSNCNRVLLKVVKVTLHNDGKSLETYAVLDDGSKRTILLQPATQQLQLQGEAEKLVLRMVRQDVKMLHGSSVAFRISPAASPRRSYRIQRMFTGTGRTFSLGSLAAEEVPASAGTPTAVTQPSVSIATYRFRQHPPHHPNRASAPRSPRLPCCS